MSPADFYALLRQTGQHHGPAFAALSRIVRLADGSAETEISIPDEAPRHPGYRLHPVVLDAALQSVGAAIPDGEIAGSAEASYLPVSFETIRVYRDIGRHVRCRAHLTNLDGGTGKMGRIVLINDAGHIAAEVDGIYLRRVERRAVPLPLEQKIFDAEWTESPIAAVPAPEPAAETTREVGWYSPMQRWMRQARPRPSRWPTTSCSSGARRCGGCTPPISTTNRRCWPHLQKRQAIPSTRRLAWWCSSAVPRVDWTTSWRRRATRCGRSPRWFVRSSARGTADHRGYGWSPGADFPLPTTSREHPRRLP